MMIIVTLCINLVTQVCQQVLLVKDKCQNVIIKGSKSRMDNSEGKNYNLRQKSQRNAAREDFYAYDEHSMNQEAITRKTRKSTKKQIRQENHEPITQQDIKKMAKILVKFVESVNLSWQVYSVENQINQQKKEIRMNRRQNMKKKAIAMQQEAPQPIVKKSQKVAPKSSARIQKTKKTSQKKQEAREEEPERFEKNSQEIEEECKSQDLNVGPETQTPKYDPLMVHLRVAMFNYCKFVNCDSEDIGNNEMEVQGQNNEC